MAVSPILRLKGTRLTCRLRGSHMAKAENGCRREGGGRGYDIMIKPDVSIGL